MFTVIGKIKGRQCQLKYIDGTLSGDTIALQKAEVENKKNHGNLGIPPSIKSNYLAHENSAYFFVTGIVFDDVISAEDDWPELPKGVYQ
jgi:hypothetical protein